MRPVLVLAVCAVVLLALVAVSLVAGSKETSVAQIVAVLGGAGDDYTRAIIDSRVPRTILGVLVGAALALSGVLIQGLTRNPLGDPGLLGVSVGATAAIVTATALLGRLGGQATVGIALVGALATMIGVWAVGGRGRGGGTVRLVLTGAVITAVLGAYVQAMTLTMPTVFDSYRYWVVGALAGRGFETIGSVAPVLLAGFALCVLLASGLDALALGDDTATSLGVRVPVVRGGAVVAAALLSAGATAAVGPIAFVGLAVPHLVRALVGTDHRWRIPAALLVGASVLLAADVVGRVIARPEELMVGIVTAFVGAPVLLLAVRRGLVAR